MHERRVEHLLAAIRACFASLAGVAAALFASYRKLKNYKKKK